MNRLQQIKIHNDRIYNEFDWLWNNYKVRGDLDSDIALHLKELELACTEIQEIVDPSGLSKIDKLFIELEKQAEEMDDAIKIICEDYRLKHNIPK